ncbi:MAG TPA: tRNA lysidine(34) synthetase TilS [Candidatus Omnitrophota bacterium]|nr:tRNA lysidine(34) synthetase TilS [Candidatus Omnitrophota bacterium]
MKKKVKTRYPDFFKKVKDTVSHYDMVRKGEKVLVAVSGGADSVSLVTALRALSSGLGIEIVVATLDHGTRAGESAREALFVADLAESLGLKCVSEKLRFPSRHQGRISLEEKLRQKRYEFFIRTAKAQGCSCVATGHNMDDQAETVLMRVIKGSSADGLAGIPPVRTEQGIRFIRPLIRISRKDIVSFVNVNGIKHVEDSSNADQKFLRNRIRMEVLPFLEKINPEVRSSLVNIADSVREDLLFAAACRKEKAECVVPDGQPRTGVKLREYLAQPAAVRREIFKRFFVSSGGSVKKLSYRHWMLLDNFARTQSKGRSLDLPGGVTAVKSGGKISFSRSA